MKGKVVPLKPRHENTGFRQDKERWSKIVESVQPQAEEMESCLQQEINRSPLLLRDTLKELARHGDRRCPVLFITIARQKEEDQAGMPRLAASLEALSLALQVHRGVEDSSRRDALSSTESILAGDFFFSLALTLAGDAPIFIKGMSEIIARVVSSELNRPTRHIYFQALRKAYLQRVSDGSASIMALSGTLGACYAGLQYWQNQALAFFSHYLGMGLKLQEEMVVFANCLQEQAVAPELTLPLIYILEHSPRREELLALLNRSRGVFSDHELLKKEFDRVKPSQYMNRVIDSCFGKAGEFLGLLQESINRETIAVLENFMRIKR